MYSFFQVIWVAKNIRMVYKFCREVQKNNELISYDNIFLRNTFPRILNIIAHRVLTWEFKFYSQTIPSEKTLRIRGIMDNCFLYRMRGRRYKEKRKEWKIERKWKRERQEAKERKLNGWLTAYSCLFSMSRSRSDAWKISHPLKNPRESISQGSQSGGRREI